MVIAANFRKYPEAMALQFPLRLGKPRWHTSRPTTRLGRAFRAAVGAAAKAAAALPWAARLELAKIGKKIVPQWVKDAQSRARALGVWVREALMVLEFDQEERLTAGCQKSESWQPLTGMRGERIPPAGVGIRR